MSVKKLIGIALAIVVVIITQFVIQTPPAGLSLEGFRAISLLAVGLCLWVTEALPVAITAIMVLVMIPLFGVTPLDEATKSFMNPSIVFLLGCFGISALIVSTHFPMRIIKVLIRFSGNNARSIILIFMIATALCSSIMADLPCAVAFFGIISSFTKAIDAKPGESNLCKCLYLGIGVAAMFGGFATPAGASTNILAMGILEANYGIEITFVQWMIVGVPASALMVFVCWFSITRVLKPEPVPDKAYAALQTELNSLGKMSAYEIKAGIVITVLFVLWVISSFITSIDITTVTIFMLVIMFLPKMDLLTWEIYNKETPWNVVIVFGCMNCLAGSIVSTGADAWIADVVLTNASTLGPVGLLLVISGFLVFMHIIFPVGPAMVGLFTVPLCTIALTTGYFSPAAATILVGFAFAGTFFIPINMIYLITYSAGYYTFTDCMKAGAGPTIVYWLMMASWVPFMTSVIGL